MNSKQDYTELRNERDEREKEKGMELNLNNHK
jgi:hypothetical protein